MSPPVTLNDYATLAQTVLPQMVLDYYARGAGDEQTLRQNQAAFARLQLRPRVCVDVQHRDLSVHLLGQHHPFPILIAPMAFQCLAHPQGELATAEAAAALGVPIVLSTMSTQSLEAVAQAQPHAPRWFQLYIHRDRTLTQTLVRRAEAAGYQALCLTVDAPVLGRRDCDQRNQFTLPPHLQLANLVSIQDLQLPPASGESGLLRYFAEQMDPSITWQDLDWLRSLTTLPIVVKGILRGDDAQRAVDHGAQGIVVSNHGGRQLDGAITTIEALPDIVAAVGEQMDVLIDGGIHRGTDVLKALALGAKAVLVGRPILWGLAVEGPQGVQHVLEILRDELDVALALSGCTTLSDIDVSLVKKSIQY